MSRISSNDSPQQSQRETTISEKKFMSFNRLRKHHHHQPNNNNNNDNNNNNNNNNDNKLFNRLFKRYSNIIGSRITSGIYRTEGVQRHSKNAQNLAYGSYNMSGTQSDDHRLEIGAPVLISATTLNKEVYRLTDAKQIDWQNKAKSSPLSSSLSPPQKTPSTNHIETDQIDTISELPSCSGVSKTLPTNLSRQKYSRSAQNLHRKKLQLPKTLSLSELNKRNKDDIDNVQNIPKLSQLLDKSTDNLMVKKRTKLSHNNNKCNENGEKACSFHQQQENAEFAPICDSVNFCSNNSLLRQKDQDHMENSSKDNISFGSSFNTSELISVSYQNLKVQQQKSDDNNAKVFDNSCDNFHLYGISEASGDELLHYTLPNNGSCKVAITKKEKIRKNIKNVKNWIDEESTKMLNKVQKRSTQQYMGVKLKDNPNNSVQNGITNESSSYNVPQLGEGQNGFEELRRFIKQGDDFSKELVLILQERIDSEHIYTKSLAKLAHKLKKACRNLPGNIAETWRNIASEMESRSEMHRQYSVSLTDDIVKPLKTIVDNHNRRRKSVENTVDKASRVLAEWRVNEAKAKKASHVAARENEKLQDATLDVRIQKSPSIVKLHQSPNKTTIEKENKQLERDCVKLDNKRKKAEEAVKRADAEYYKLCIRAERARVDWEIAVLRASANLQNIEKQRLTSMKTFVSNYARITENMNSIFNNLLHRLQPQIEKHCDVADDMQIVNNIRRNSEGLSEQLLPDFYCEHTTLAMNRERRKHSLIKLLQLVKGDLERERRSRDNLKGLSQTINGQENTNNIAEKLHHVRSVLNYLEGARFKLHSALLELDHKPRTSHPLAQHIQITRDRGGIQQSILRVPIWLKVGHDNNSIPETANTIQDDSKFEYLSQSSKLSTSSLYEYNRPISRSKSNMETTSFQQDCPGGSGNVGATKSKTLLTHLTQTNGLYDAQSIGDSIHKDSDFDDLSSIDGQFEQQSHSTHSCDNNFINDEKKLRNSINPTIDMNDGEKNRNSHHVDESTYSNSLTQINGLNKNINNMNSKTNSTLIARCKALYHYQPKLYDELEINPGDIIEVHAKQEDGWWLGALGNQVGIFPATYVEEFA